MSLVISVSLVLFVLLVTAVLILYFMEKSRNPIQKGDLHPKGHWMGVGFSWGIPLGVIIGMAFGLAIGNNPVGFSMGASLGTVIGAALGLSLERKNPSTERPLTDREKNIRKWALILACSLLILTIVAISLWL